MHLVEPFASHPGFTFALLLALGGLLVWYAGRAESET